MEHRRCIAVRGDRAATSLEARRCVARLRPEEVLWVSDAEDATRRAEVRRLLGRGYDAVVLDLHEDVDADLIGLAHGFVRAGGALVLRLPGGPRTVGSERLAVFPFSRDEAGTAFSARLDAWVAAFAAGAAEIAPPAAHTVGSEQQNAVVSELVATWSGETSSRSVLTADRGRGKSAALGLALTRLDASRAFVTAPDRGCASEVLRFAPEMPFVQVDEALDRETPRVIVVDEAAQIPVATLKALVARHQGAHLAFATTTRGYEGTGRGFVLRFLTWLDAEQPTPRMFRLETPIRWEAGDPLERQVFDLLALDAQPARVEGSFDPDRVVASPIEKSELCGDEALLRQVWGLLVDAHYRTTPSDLERLLDAPNLSVWALRHEGAVVAVTLLAQEGRLPPESCRAILWSGFRPRGHALAETLVCHGGRVDAGALAMVRSVRIAVVPELRRLGLARRLVEAVHAAHRPDLFGTLFGATSDLVHFRQSVGYEVVRLGASRGSRTGEPTAVMVCPVSEAARALVRDLRGDLARDLELQLALIGHDAPLEPSLVDGLAKDLGDSTPRSPGECGEAVRQYALGSRPFEAVAGALFEWLEVRPRATFPEDVAALIRLRLCERRSWADAARGSGFPSVPAAMRACKRALANELLAR